MYFVSLSLSSCSVELSALKTEVTHRLTLDLTSGQEQGSITVTITITGTEVTESLSVDMDTIAKNYVSEPSFLSWYIW